MCGRYTVFTQDEDSLMTKFLKQAGFNEPMSEIYPTNAAPIIMPFEGKITARCAFWGFPLTNSSKPVINACSESAAGKRFFSDALYRRRCVIPATGFFEWCRKTKDKYIFTPRYSDLMYMAGAYNVYGAFKRFVIFTRPADEDVSDVHNRMPVLIAQENVREYLLGADYFEDAFIMPPPELNRSLVSS